ncbi:hypothetical protein QQX98_005376 [Neonectria punicea]|uniref:Uncharacterized protein n=1 Tax=Neonectria punicea TaxID=979145 RepID=A0ABR1H5H4_9HYPO
MLLITWATGALIYNLFASIHSVTVDAKVHINVPKGVSRVIDHQFAGIAMESASWPNFTHAFSQNLFNALSSRTGKDLIIRIGGKSMDHTIYDLKQKESVKRDKGSDSRLRSNSTLGRIWFDTFGQVNNVTFTLQFGFARDHGNNVTGAVEYIYPERSGQNRRM